MSKRGEIYCALPEALKRIRKWRRLMKNGHAELTELSYKDAEAAALHPDTKKKFIKAFTFNPTNITYKVEFFGPEQ